MELWSFPVKPMKLTSPLLALIPIFPPISFTLKKGPLIEEGDFLLLQKTSKPSAENRSIWLICFYGICSY